MLGGSKRPASDEELIFSQRQHNSNIMNNGNNNNSSTFSNLHHRNPFINNGSYPIIHNTSTHNNLHTFSFHRIRRLITHRPTFFWWGVAFCCLLFLFARLPSSPRPSAKRRYEILFTHDLVEYQDTSQMTDYELLDKLLKNEQGMPFF